MRPNIPHTWLLRTLGDLDGSTRHTIDPGKYPEEVFEYYSIPAYQGRQAPITTKGVEIASTKLLLEPGSVLFGKLNPRVEKVWRVRTSSGLRQIGSTEWLPIVPNEEIDPAFLYFLCWSEQVMGVAKGQVSGSTPSRQRVDPSAFYKIRVPIPPKDEQQQIATVLLAVQRAIEQQERLIALTAELKKALMHKLFTEGTRGEPMKQTDFGVVPQSWEVLTLNDLKLASEKRAIVSGPFGSNIGKRFFVDSGVPLIRGCNLTKGEKLLVEEGFVFITEEKANELSGCVAVEGDLIFTAAGTLGQVGLIPAKSLFPKYVISNKQLRARLDKSRVRPEFVFHWFASDTIQSLIEQRRGGASIPVINLSILKALPVPLPSVEEQDLIVGALAATQAKREQHQRQAQALIALFHTLLHQLMTAQIRVHDLDLSVLEEAEREPVRAA